MGLSKVKLSKACVMNIFRHVVEHGGERESVGDLVGKREGSRIFVSNSTPWVTVKSTLKSFKVDNFLRPGRIASLEDALRSSGHSHGIVGHYHTHPYEKQEKRESPELSEKDLKFFRELMDSLKMDESVQVVVSVKKRSYAKKQEVGERVIDYPMKTRTILRYALQNNGRRVLSYDLIFGAYLLGRENVRELKIRRR